jgi:hypothetical protein
VLIPLGLWLVAASAVFAEDADEPIRAAEGFKKVDVFARNAFFVTTTATLDVLRTTEKGPPKAILGIGRYNRQPPVAVAESGDALLVSDGKTIFRVTPAGESKTLLTLGTLRADSIGKDFPDRYEINSFLAAGPRDTLYFVLMPRGRAVRSYVCRCQPTSGRLEVIDCPFPSGIDIDRERDIVYVPPLSNSHFASSTPVLLVTKFSDGGQARRRPVHHTYDWCQLSADGKSLLMSGPTTENEPHISILDLSSDRETVLPFGGSFATWGAGAGRSIYFVRGNRTLWTAKLGAASAAAVSAGAADADKTEPTLVCEAAGKPDSDTEGNYGAPPVLSRDGSWLAWRWTIKTPNGPWKGTVLIDLKNREYRPLNQSWLNVNWAK